MLQVDLKVVLKVFSDTGQVHPRRHTHRSEMICRPHARELKKLRGIDCPPRTNHLPGKKLLHTTTATGFDTDHARAFKKKACRMRAGE